MREVDVLIIGAGPAGAAAALESRNAGLETLIVEKQRLPRHKACSGLVIPETTELIRKHFGTPPERIFARPGSFKGMRMHFKSGRSFDVPIGGWMVWRDRFDHWLCRQSGAEILDGTRLLSFSEDKSGVTARCCTLDGDALEIRSNVMVAADGGGSLVALALDPKKATAVEWFVAMQHTVRARCDLEPGYFHFFAQPEISKYPAAYWKDDFLVMDVGVTLGEKSRPHMDRLIRHLTTKHGLEIEEVVLRLGCRVAFAAPKKRFCFGTERVLLAGEASGLLNMFGEGISPALATGLLAGKCASESSRDGVLPGGFYRARVQYERKKTESQYSTFTQFFGTIGGIDWKDGLRTVPLHRLPFILKDLGNWFLFESGIRKGGLPN